MTHGEFIERIEGAVDTAVDTLTRIAPIGRMAWLGRFQHRVAAQWRDLFAPMLTPEDVDATVTSIAETIRARVSEIERGGATLH